MGRISRLHASLINQIAAGEVVVQPSSVIKECIENSFDAGSSEIQIEFDGTGAERLKIADNGCGMDEEDLLLSVEAHATSKIRSIEDLYSVKSCGFRGEALASIAEVAELEIHSRTAEQKHGNRLYKVDGSFKIEPTSRQPGTTLLCQNLFHNVPVRRRFLKSERSEAAQNLNAIKMAALSRPWVAIRATHNQKLCFDLPANQSLSDRIKDLQLFGRDAQIKDVQFHTDFLTVEGVMAAPPTHYGNSQKILLTVNRRPFKDKALIQAVVQAYASYIPDRRYPGVMLDIQIEPEDVDVNIHPSKSEVRFQDAPRVFKAVVAALREQLKDQSQLNDQMETQTLIYKSSGLSKTIPMNRSYGHSPAERQRPFSPANDTPSFSYPSGPLSEAEKISLQVEEKAPELNHENFTVKKDLRSFQVLKRFIIIEHENHIEMMDQHAIHERILYNQLAHEESEKSYVSQWLITPVALELPENLGDLHTELLFELKQMGFLVEKKDKGQLELVAIPDFLSAERGTRVLEGILEDLAEGIQPDKQDLRRDILHSAACRAAIKAGDELSNEELKNITSAISTMDLGQGCCPHGRNAVWKIDVKEANSMFNR